MHTRIRRYGCCAVLFLMAVGCTSGSTPTPMPAPAPAPTPSGPPLDCSAFVTQSTQVQAIIKAGATTQADAVSICQKTLATACTANEMSIMLNPTTAEWKSHVACAEQYAQFLSALVPRG